MMSGISCCSISDKGSDEEGTKTVPKNTNSDNTYNVLSNSNSDNLEKREEENIFEQEIEGKLDMTHEATLNPKVVKA